MTNSTNNSASAADVLLPESPQAFALRMLVAAGLVSQEKVDSALSLAAKFRAHDPASAQAKGQEMEFDGDSEATRRAFRDYDADYPVRHRSDWQIWRDAIAYAAKSGVAAPSPALREAGDGVTEPTPTLSEDVLMQAIADTAARGHVWASRALSNFRAAVREAAKSPNDAKQLRQLHVAEVLCQHGK
ncbi:hypothetical protein [Paraburkholderia strydomiana]|uniref:Uncharacterized protein n=1 Tax=Paraburkholderia strydomiana TaxID=1245417 RepID=A0ABW9BSK8_9BURK